MADLEALVNRVLGMEPASAFLLVAQIFEAGKSDVAWAIANRICDEQEAAEFMKRARALRREEA